MFLIQSYVLCLFQLALAEEYKKPIITLRLENVSEIDPGLKLIIMKRQVSGARELMASFRQLCLCGFSVSTVLPTSMYTNNLDAYIFCVQWIDFLEESDFETSSRELVTAICTTVGGGSGPEL